MTLLLEERLWPKVLAVAPDQCWPWVGAIQGGGYGIIRAEGGRGYSPLYAHRVVYELSVGPIPPGTEIDHRCRNLRCVNPAHLEAIPHRLNVLRGEGPSSRNARKTRCKRGHRLDGANVYRTPDGRRQCRACKRNWRRS